MVKYYSLVTIFPDFKTNTPRVEVKFIDVSHYAIQRKMKKMAVDYVCNEIGKNKFVNTLEGEYKDLPVDKCPPGLVLKTPAEGELSYKDGHINVWMNKRVTGLLITYNNVKLVGTFAVIASDSTSVIVEKNFKPVVEEIKKRLKAAPAYDALDVSCIQMDEDDEDDEDDVVEEYESDSTENCEDTA